MASDAAAAQLPGAPVQRGVHGWFTRTFDSMSNRNLRLLWIGTLLNFAAVTMHQTAQGVVAYDLTGNNRAVGTVMFGSGLSMLFLSPFAGALADRFSKRLMLITCQAVLLLTFVFLGFSIAADFISIPLLAFSSFLSSMMFATIRSVRNAYIGELATPDQRGNAVALQQLALSTMSISGPFLAGVLLGWDVIGSAGTFYFMAGAFGLAIVTMLQLPPANTRIRPVGSPNILQETAEGLRYGWNHPEIRWVLGGFFLLTIFGMPYMTLLPGYTKDVLEVSTSRLGVLLGISAVGGFVVSLFAASMADSRKSLPMLAACNVLFGASLIGLAVAPGFWIAVAISLFLGAGASGFQVLNLAVALRAADVAHMGRVASLTLMAGSISGIVALPVGVLADSYGERPIFFGMGVCVIVVAIVLATWRRKAAVETATA